MALARMEEERSGNTGSPVSGVSAATGNPRGAVWAGRVADRFVVLRMWGNACGGKEP